MLKLTEFIYRNRTTTSRKVNLVWADKTVIIYWLTSYILHIDVLRVTYNIKENKLSYEKLMAKSFRFSV